MLLGAKQRHKTKRVVFCMAYQRGIQRGVLSSDEVTRHRLLQSLPMCMRGSCQCRACERSRKG